MVNTGDSGTTTAEKIDLPEIEIQLSTFTNYNPVSIANEQPTSNRFCTFTITISNVKISLAQNAFNRVFQYVQNLANNDINPVPSVNLGSIINIPNSLQSSPKGVCNLLVDKSGLIPLVSLLLSSENLRIDYMDEFFTRTLDYLTASITQDLNPDD